MKEPRIKIVCYPILDFNIHVTPRFAELADQLFETEAVPYVGSSTLPNPTILLPQSEGLHLRSIPQKLAHNAREVKLQ
jgi:hypothetical protein